MGGLSATWEELRPYAALHALGSLDGEELTRLRAALPALAEAEKEEYRHLVRVSQLLLFSAEPAVPPPSLKSRIFERIQVEKPRPPGLELRRRPAAPLDRLAAGLGMPIQRLLGFFCLLLALLAGLSAFGVWNGFRAGAQARAEIALLARSLEAVRDSLGEWERKAAVLGAAGLQTVKLQPAGPDPASGAVLWDPAGGAALLQTHGLPPRGDYVLWVIADGRALPALRFRPEGKAGELRRIAKLPESDRRRITAFLVTQEKDPAAPRPQGNPWLEGAPLL